jgi:hypothetical protein
METQRLSNLFHLFRLLNLKIFFPDDILIDLLNLFYVLLFEDVTETPHHLKTAISHSFGQLLK